MFAFERLIAEGAGELSPRDKRRFHRMARRSGTEAAAILQVIARRDQVSEAHLREALTLLPRIVSMLVRMSQPPRPSRRRNTDPR
jgi:four helix bundle protein